MDLNEMYKKDFDKAHRLEKQMNMIAEIKKYMKGMLKWDLSFAIAKARGNAVKIIEAADRVMHALAMKKYNDTKLAHELMVTTYNFNHIEELLEKVDFYAYEKREFIYEKYGIIGEYNEKESKYDYNILQDKASLIVARKIILEIFQIYFNITNKNDIINYLENQFAQNGELEENCTLVIKLLKMDEEDFVSKKELKVALDKYVACECYFEINCGGHALKVKKIISNAGKDEERIVTDILDKLNFVRLLGDTELCTDEYLVLYKARKGGHHFVRVEDDGIITEKCANAPPKKFSGWHPTYKGCKEIAFAVKRVHETSIYEELPFLWFTDGEIFDERAERIIKESQTVFSYHSHDYVVDKDTSIIFSGDKVVADILSEGDEFTVVVREEEREYISNLTSKHTQNYIKQAARAETIDR